jgi:hypothetical protein
MSTQLWYFPLPECICCEIACENRDAELQSLSHSDGGKASVRRRVHQ